MFVSKTLTVNPTSREPLCLYVTSLKEWNLTIFPYLELDILGVLLDLDGLGVLAPGLEQEVLDLLDLARHDGHLGIKG